MKKILALLIVTASPANALEQFCPGEDIPYTFTVFEDVLTINRAYHRAFCQPTEGDEFECMEKWPGDDAPSVYSIHASLLEDRSLSIKLPLDEEPAIVKPCE